MSKRFGLAALLLSALSHPPAYAASEIGTAVWVKNEAALENGVKKKPFNKGSSLYQGETIVTGNEAVAEVQLLDQAKLAIGPNAKIGLGKGGSQTSTPGLVTVTLAKGAFRFITGTSPKSAYEIKTPAAFLLVHGAVFDAYAGDGGETAILIHEGEVEVCPLAGSCSAQGPAQQIVYLRPGEAVALHPHWDGSLLPGVSARTAFPFVGQRLVIDPVQRGSLAALEAPDREEPPPANTNPHDDAKAIRLINVTGEVYVNKGQGFQRVTGETSLAPADRVRTANGSADIVYGDGTIAAVKSEQVLAVSTQPVGQGSDGAGSLSGLSSTELVTAGVIAGAIVGGVVAVEVRSSKPASP